MASQGPNAPSSSTSNGSNGGSYTWTNITNAYSSDNNYAYSNISPGGTSYQILYTGFGFSIPSGAAINGVEVVIERKKTGNAGSSVRDAMIKLVKGGVVSGNDKKAAGVNWPTTDGTYTYGGSSDLWGLSLTDTDINATDFGVAVAVSVFGSKWSNNANIDYISITVYYTTSGGGSTSSSILLAGD